MLKAIKIRLYPNKEQEIYIGKLLGCYRFVYNKCLEQKQTAYTTDKKNLGLKELGKYFHNSLTKSEEYSFLKEHNTKVLKQSIMNMMEAYKRFFVSNNGFPKFKSKKDNKHTCRFPLEAISKRNDYNSGRLSLTSDLKNIKFKCSDKYKHLLTEYKKGIRSATLTKTNTNKYFLSILIECTDTKILPSSDKVVGIDLGIKDFIITSDGVKYNNLKSIRSNQKTLKRLHKRLSKKQKGSKNKTKARIKLAKKHERLTNQKEAYLHKIINELLYDNQVVVMEDLNVKGMMKNHKLARSIQELSLGDFKTKLLYKAEWAYREIVEVDRFFPSSKLCSDCGYKNNLLTLKDREWACPDCGVVHDRDVNAATNIKYEGIRILNTPMESKKNSLVVKNKIGCRTAEFKPVEIRSVDDRCESNLKSTVLMKQEIENGRCIDLSKFL